MADKIIINLTDAAPVRIDPDEWPIIARGSSGGSTATDAKAEITVRQHSDGRFIAYGYLSHSTFTNERRVHTGGALYDPSETIYRWEIADLINRVANSIGAAAEYYVSDSHDYCRDAARNCINSLPPVDL